jgi:hypothetical protein
MNWAPEPKPKLMRSRYRFRVRRTAHGWALYDHALGERHSYHRTVWGAIIAKRHEHEAIKQIKCAEAEREPPDSQVYRIEVER